MARAGFTDIRRYPHGYLGWQELHPERRAGKDEDSLHAGDSLPEVRLSILGGTPDRRYLGLPDEAVHMRLADIRARYVLIQFFNCLCAECRYELEQMDGFLASLSPEESGIVRIIGIAVHDEARRVAAFRRNEGVGFPLFVDRSDVLLERFGIVAPPAACLLEQGEHGPVIRRVVSGTREERKRFLEDVRLVITAHE